MKTAHIQQTSKQVASDGTKQKRMIAMLKRAESATIEQLAKTLQWQPHTVRSTISGVLKKRLSLSVTSQKEEGDRVYRIA